MELPRKIKDLFSKPAPPRIGKTTAVRDFAYPISHPKHVVAIFPPGYSTKNRTTRTASEAEESLDSILSRSTSKTTSSSITKKQPEKDKSLHRQKSVQDPVLGVPTSSASPIPDLERSLSTAAPDQTRSKTVSKLEEITSAPLTRYLPQSGDHITEQGAKSYLSNNLEALRLRSKENQIETNTVDCVKEHIVSVSEGKIQCQHGEQSCSQEEEAISANTQENINGPHVSVLAKDPARCNQPQMIRGLERQDSAVVVDHEQPHMILTKFGEVLWDSENPINEPRTADSVERMIDEANTRIVSRRFRKNTSMFFDASALENCKSREF